MSIKYILASLLFNLSTISIFATNSHEEVIKSYLKDGELKGVDVKSVYNEFAKWKAEEPNSLEIDDTWAWYYNTVSYRKGIKHEEQKPSFTEDFLEVKENGKSEFIYFDVAINCDSFKIGYDIIEKAIAKNPDCLYLYMTKAALIAALIERDTHDNLFDLSNGKKVMSENERYHYLMKKALTHPKKEGDVSVLNDLDGQFVSFFSSLVDHSVANKNKWYDMNRKKMADGEKMLLEVLEAGFSVLFDEKKFESATKLNNKYLSVYPKNRNFVNNRAKIAIATKDYETALETLKVIHKEYPKDDNTSLSLALAYEVTKHKKEALEIYKTLEKSSDSRIAAMAKKSCARLKK